MNLDKFFVQPRQTCINQLIVHLERSAWGKGVFMRGKVVAGARPAQIRAGARKLYDKLWADYRAEKITNFPMNG